MNAVIEYVLRHNRIEQMLTLPCSLFLESAARKKEKPRLILTLTQGYGTGSILVRRYNVNDASKDDWLPPFTETAIPLAGIFSSKEVIVPGYKLLEFQEQPWDSDAKQVAELPLAAIQERQYGECLTNFLNPKIMFKQRENWLWTCFSKIYIPDEIRTSKYLNSRLENSREQVLRSNKSCQRLWEHWKKYLLLASTIASELVFAKKYKAKISTYHVPKKRKSLYTMMEELGIPAGWGSVPPHLLPMLPHPNQN